MIGTVIEITIVLIIKHINCQFEFPKIISIIDQTNESAYNRQIYRSNLGKMYLVFNGAVFSYDSDGNLDKKDKPDLIDSTMIKSGETSLNLFIDIDQTLIIVCGKDFLLKIFDENDSKLVEINHKSDSIYIFTQKCSFVKTDTEYIVTYYIVKFAYYYKKFQKENTEIWNISQPSEISKNIVYLYCDVFEEYQSNPFFIWQDDSPDGNMFVSLVGYEKNPIQLDWTASYFDFIKADKIFVVVSITNDQKTIEGRILSATIDRSGIKPSFSQKTILISTNDVPFHSSLGLAKFDNESFVLSALIPGIAYIQKFNMKNNELEVIGSKIFINNNFDAKTTSIGVFGVTLQYGVVISNTLKSHEF